MSRIISLVKSAESMKQRLTAKIKELTGENERKTAELDQLKIRDTVAATGNRYRLSKNLIGEPARVLEG